MIDFVIPLGRGSQFKNCELRYCLRSLEKYGKGIRRVVIVGETNPGFLSKDVVFLQSPKFPICKEARIATKIQWAWGTGQLTDEILFGNDDYFFLKPFDARTVPYFQRGPLIESATSHRRPVARGEKWEPVPNQKVLQATHDALVAAKLPTMSYELHYPIRYQRDVYCEHLKLFWDAGSKSPHGLAPRSIYGNYLFPPNAPGPFLNDSKIGRFFGEANLETRLARKPDRICLSYGDQALFEGLEKWLYARFPTKSRFESSWGSGTQ